MHILSTIQRSENVAVLNSKTTTTNFTPTRLFFLLLLLPFIRCPTYVKNHVSSHVLINALKSKT